MNPVVDTFGTKRWYNDNRRFHRDDGPAVEYQHEYTNGSKEWYIDGRLHRLDGPAIEWNDGDQEWYINGKRIDCNSNEEFLRIVKMKELL
jgi:hypothetical protein